MVETENLKPRVLKPLSAHCLFPPGHGQRVHALVPLLFLINTGLSKATGST